MKKKILVVDDDKVIADVMAKCLEEESREIIKAYEGETAYQIILDKKPEIVITDLRMPGMSGWELFDKTKNINPDTIFIFVTGYGNIPDAAESIKKGVFDYLEKPFSTQKLKLTVKSATEYHNIALENQELQKKLMYVTEHIEDFENLVLTSSKLRRVSNFGLVINRIESHKELYRLLLKAAVEITGTSEARLYRFFMEDEKMSLSLFDFVTEGKKDEDVHGKSSAFDSEGIIAKNHLGGEMASDQETLCIQIQDVYPLWGVLYLEKKISGEKYNIEDFLHVSILARKVAKRLNELVVKKRVLGFPSDSDDVKEGYKRLKTQKLVTDEALLISTLILDRKFNILDMDQVYRNNFGSDSSSVGGSFWEEPIWKSLKESIRNQLLAAVEEKKIFTWAGKVPLGMSGKDWSIRFRVIPTKAIIANSKEEYCYLIIIEDFTEIEKIKKELTILENLITLESFSASVAHDLNNLIDGLNRLLQVLEKQARSLISAEYFKIIYSTINKIEATITLLQEEAWSKQLKQHRLPLDKLLEEAIFLMSSRFSEKRITVKKHYEAGCQDISIPADIYNVFINIMKNAFEAMGMNGTLDIWIKQNDDPCYVDVVFEDDGCGVPDDLLEFFGKPFFTTKENGTGLGLVLCEKTLRKYNGWLNMSPRTPRGTTVTVSFPKAIN